MEGTSLARPREVPIIKVDRLKISSDKHELEQQVFLDIECFPICVLNIKVIHIWRLVSFPHLTE